MGYYLAPRLPTGALGRSYLGLHSHTNSNLRTYPFRASQAQRGAQDDQFSFLNEEENGIKRTDAPRSFVSLVLAEMGPVLKYAIPTLCIAVTSPLLTLVDTSVVGLHSSQHLAAMTPATAITDGLSYIMTFIPMAVTNLVALHMARKNHKAAGKVVSEALALAAGICIALSAVMGLAGPQIIRAMGSFPADMVATASQYVAVSAIGFPCAVCNGVMQAFFLACRAPLVPLLATIGAGTVNLFGDLLLCRVFSFGAAGAAAATSAANIIVFFFLVHRLQQKLPEGSVYAGIRVPIAPKLPRLEAARNFAALAGPMLGVLVLKVAMLGGIGVRAASIGPAAAASHKILFSFAMLMGIFGDTVCSAAQAFLPPRIGTPVSAWSLTAALALCACLVGVFNASFGTFIAASTLSLFTADPAVTSLCLSTMPLLGLQFFTHALSMGTEGVLLAARDGWFLLASYVSALALLQVLLHYTLSLGWGLQGCWVGMSGFMLFRLAMNSARVLRPGSVLSSTVPLEGENETEMEGYLAIDHSNLASQPPSGNNSEQGEQQWSSSGAATLP